MPSTPRSRSTASVHQEAVARRLAELCAQLGTPLSLDEEAAKAEDAGEADGHLASPGRVVYVAPAVGADWWDGYTHPPRPPLHLVAPADPTPTPAIGPPVPVPPPTPAPEPGRHASRRSVPDVGGPGSRRPVAMMADLLDGLVPETLRGRVRLGISQLVVVVMLVALGLGVVLWSLARSRPTTTDLASATSLPSGLPVGAPTTSSGDPAPATSGASGAASPGAAVAPSATTSAAATGRLTVDVAGRVRHPGIEVLPPGSRVIDALRRAGGARPGVDLTTLNLARPLVDGEQILVGVKADASAPVTPGSTTGSGTTASGVPTSPVDLNTATEEELEALPDVGPVTAGSILSWRQAHGGFTSVDELLEVDGIGPATLAKLTPYVTV